MFLDPKNFARLEITLGDVYLDPNNPRFSDVKDVLIDDSKITDDAVQAHALQRIKQYGVKDLVESIQNIGFLKIDRVVVRKIRTDPKKYVVVEGSRRMAACKIINEAYKSSEVPPNVAEIIDTIQNLEVLLYEGDEEDISWIIQGIRHISGVRAWRPFQQAQLLVKLEEERGVEPQIASETLGIGPIVAARLVRAYYGYRQAEEDEEYGSYITPAHFAYFNEVALARVALRDWLEWNDEDRKFENAGNLKKMLSWFIKTEEDSKKETKISQARELRDIVVRALIEEKDLFRRFVSDEDMTADDLQFELGKRSTADEAEWYDRIADFSNDIEDLPTFKILDRKKEFIAVLTDLIKKLQKHMEILQKM